MIAGAASPEVRSVAGWIGTRRRVQPAQKLKNVLIVGSGVLGRRIAIFLTQHPGYGRSFCGFLDDRPLLRNGVVGRIGELAEIARRRFIDEVIVACPHDQDLLFRVLEVGRRLRLDVKVAADFFGQEAVRSETYGNIPILSLHEEKLPLKELFYKRCLDVAFSAILLLFTAPALTLIAILIKLDSRGPVFYKALRAGRKGRPFRCFKFRTMVPEADDLKEKLRNRNERSGPFFKIKHDPRVSGIGKVLRRYSLDELPQLWNVLKGDMSLVGPRPHPLDDVSGYSIEHLPRLDVTPGLTGLWQVTARSDPSFQRGVNLDLEYIHRWTLAMDLKILCKTAGAVLRGSGE